MTRLYGRLLIAIAAACLEEDFFGTSRQIKNKFSKGTFLLTHD